ncbi:MAG: tRNA dihydrouridine synthase DusB [Ruminococcaceae bacterium]|nr:tRNA dihydrouridine synthase DusB [Oscillospiraceae bacterium]
MKIRNINFENGVFLAPMAGVADRAFRHMCKKYGADGVVTEMISSKATVFGDKKTKELARIENFERPCALQLFGSEPETMARAASFCMEFSPDMIDINMGCPVHKVVSSGDGSALMKNPQLAYEIMKAVVDAVGREIPVTVKIRRGFDKDHINAVEIALLAQKAGIDAVFVHARTREQMYAPPCDYSTIKDVKSAVSIPVIGNGDIYCAQDAARMISETGCDGVMIGRGALGNPYLFAQVKHYLKTGETLAPQSAKEKIEDIKEHMSLLVADKGEAVAAAECRKHLAWYIKGVRGAAALRDEINRTENVEKTLELIEKAFLNSEQ